MRLRMFYALFALVIWIGCNDEEALQPLNVEEPFLDLPQGDHDYDERIMEMYNKYGVAIFYKFRPQDVYFNYTTGGWGELALEKTTTTTYYNYYQSGDEITDDVVYFLLNETRDSVIVWQGNSNQDEEMGTVGPTELGRFLIGDSETEEGLKISVSVDYRVDGSPFEMSYTYESFSYVENSFSVECADSNYINKQLDLLEKILLNYYSAEVLETGMPPRIMLGRQLQLASGVGPVYQSYYRTNNNFILSHGDFTIDTLSKTDLRALKNGLNAWFLAEGMVDRLYDELSENTNFFNISTVAYTQKGFALMSSMILKKAAADGICNYYLTLEERSDFGMASPEERARMDLKMYLAMAISFPKEILEVDKSPGLNWNFEDATGRLGPSQDTQGKCKQKYDILINYMKSIGIDLTMMSKEYWED